LAQPSQIRLCAILITVAQLFRHLDVFNLRRQIQSREDGVCQFVSCVRFA
jgi:hypothetical protein